MPFGVINEITLLEIPALLHILFLLCLGLRPVIGADSYDQRSWHFDEFLNGLALHAFPGLSVIGWPKLICWDGTKATSLAHA